MLYFLINRKSRLDGLLKVNLIIIFMNPNLSTYRYMPEILPILRNTLSNQSISSYLSIVDNCARHLVELVAIFIGRGLIDEEELMQSKQWDQDKRSLQGFPVKTKGVTLLWKQYMPSHWCNIYYCSQINIRLVLFSRCFVPTNVTQASEF